METEDIIINLADLYNNNPYGGTETRIAQPDPDFNGDLTAKPIAIPQRFKDVVLKMCPEIKDIVSVGYRDAKIYDPETFNPITKYLVGVDLYFDKKSCMRKPRQEYNNEFNDYFRMVFNGMDFVTFHVQSFIFPPEKTNDDKFFEVFGVNHNPIP